MTSGNFLLNDADEKRRVLSQPDFKHSIGGEMEGWGLYMAVNEELVSRIHWVVVKGICDWGHNKDKSWQPFAAAAAVDLLSWLLRYDDGLLSVLHPL